MKIDSIRKVASIIKVVAPEYKDKNGNDLKIWIELSEPYISERKFGKLYYQALAYLTAHKMALNSGASEQDTMSGGSVSIKDMMNVSSYTEGSTSISFNNSAISSGASSGTDAEYLLTAYGVQFIAIRDRCIVPITISGMKRV